MDDGLERAAAAHDRVSNAREDAEWFAAFYTTLTESGVPEDWAGSLTGLWAKAYIGMAEGDDEATECGVDD